MLKTVGRILFGNAPARETTICVRVPFYHLSYACYSFFGGGKSGGTRRRCIRLLLGRLRSLSSGPCIGGSGVSTIFFNNNAPNVLSTKSVTSVLYTVGGAFLLTRSTRIAVRSDLSSVARRGVSITVTNKMAHFDFNVRSFGDRMEGAINQPCSQRRILGRLSVCSGGGTSVVVSLVCNLPCRARRAVHRSVQSTTTYNVTKLSLCGLRLLPSSPLKGSFTTTKGYLVRSRMRILFRMTRRRLGTVKTRGVSYSR